MNDFVNKNKYFTVHWCNLEGLDLNANIKSFEDHSWNWHWRGAFCFDLFSSVGFSIGQFSSFYMMTFKKV